MAAEGTPHTHMSLIARGLEAITRLVLCFPRTTLVITAVGLVAAVVLGATRLGYRTSRGDLLDRRSEFNQRWLAYAAEFDHKEDVVVVVEGADRATIVPVLDELAAEIARDRRFFEAVFHKLDLSPIRAKGLHYLPLEELAAIEGFLEEAGPIVQGGWALLNPGNMAAALATQLQSVPPEHLDRARAVAQHRLVRLSQSLAAALRERGAYQSPWPEVTAASAMGQGDSGHLLAKDGRMGFVALRLVDDRVRKRDFAENSEAIDSLRRLVAAAKKRHPEVQIGLTGLPIMENDEMRCSQSSMAKATTWSLVGVMAVLVAGFGGLRHPVLVMAALSIGMVLSIGYTTLAVGHLNILSSAFAAILIGLGNDYSIYYIARYLQLRAGGRAPDDALLGTARTVAPGITIGALSTAMAFFMAGLTEFVGVAELGLVAGGGIILCWWAAMTSLPAMLHLWDGKNPLRRLPAPLDFQGWLRPSLAYPLPVLALGLTVTILLAWRIQWDNFDNNLLNLQPAGLESVELERKLLAETDQSAWFAISIAGSPEDLLLRKAEFLGLPSVQRVDEIVSLLPADAERKRPVIQRIAARVGALPDRPPQIPLASAVELSHLLLQADRLMAGSAQADAFRRQLAEIWQLLQTLPESEYYARLSEFQQRMAGELLARLQQLRAAADPAPPQLADLPPGLVTRFVGKTGRHLLRVYGKGDIWNPEAMRRFVEDVRKVDPEATGNPMQVYEASLQMKRSYEQATKFALVTILPMVFLSFASLRCTLLAILPLGLATLQMFGWMGVLDIARNPANLIALPLMLGMGVDNGVHIMHDFLSQRGRYRMSPSTGAAVALNTLTTMVGFATLLLADHRGLQSLGRVLTIGMSCCLFSAMVILPALLALLTRNRPPIDQPGTEPQSACAENVPRARPQRDQLPAAA